MMNRHNMFVLSIAIVAVVVIGSCVHIPQGSVSNYDRDSIYTEYRHGTITRHIAKNGRYLQYLWLRARDSIDPTPTDPDTLVPDLEGSKRTSTHELATFWSAQQEITWYPVVYYEPMKRTIPLYYHKTRSLGFMPTQPGPRRHALYEWQRNTIKEPPEQKYQDHYYSTDPEDPVARYRYQMTGIVGFVYEDSFENGINLFEGYNQQTRNHVITSDKRAIGLIDVHYLGTIHNSANREGNPFEFDEYTRSSVGDASTSDQLYTAERTNADGTIEAFQAQLAVAGGGDNPLYQGGLSLAVFSLEAIHHVSDKSLVVAKRLFDFIESSEELTSSVLTGDAVGTGFLRRHRHAWWPQQYANGSKWGASADELTGVIFGMKYFLDATENSQVLGTQQYHERALSLLRRIATYLRDHYWVYVDTRLADNEPSTWYGEPMVTGYSFGSLMWQFPFKSVFKEYLGDGYVGDFEAIRERLLLNLDMIFGMNGMNELLEFVTQFTCLKDFQLSYGSSLDNPLEVYNLVIQNMAPIEFLSHNCANSQSETLRNLASSIQEKWGYYNNAMLLYTAILVFETDDSAVSQDKKKEIAKNIIKYVKDMLIADYGANWYNTCYGPAADNVLFAIAAKYAYREVTPDDLVSIFQRGGMRRAEAQGRAIWFERNVLDSIIKEYITGQSVPWQQWLPIGYPKQDQVGLGFPWTVHILRPPGIGRDEAWQYRDRHFEMWDNSAEGKSAVDVFQNVGPFYSQEGNFDQAQSTAADNWRPDVTANHLREFARVGREDIAVFPGPSFVIEAGGNDYMLMRMLAVQLGLVGKPILTDGDPVYNTLPVDGASPW